MKEFLKKHKKLIIFLIIALVILAVVLYVRHSVKVAQERLADMMNTSETATIERRSLVDSLAVTGIVVASDSKNVSANVTNVEVLELNVEVGDYVKEGDVICVLDSSDLEDSLKNARTSLNATQGQSNVNVSSAERALAEAETNRNIEVERANEDAAKAWQDYLRSLTDVEEAEDDYNKATKEYWEKRGELEAAQKRLEDAKNSGTASASSYTGASTSALESEFDDVVSSIKLYASQNSKTINDGVLDLLYITSTADFTSYQILKEDADNNSDILSYLNTLAGLRNDYTTAAAAEAQNSAASASSAAKQAAIAEAEQSVASWRTKVQSAESSMDAYKNTYESMITAADGKLTTYNQRVRSYEDSIRNGDSTILTRNDSLYTSQLSNSATGLTEKQQIKNYEEQIEDCIVYAPISGVVTATNVEEGKMYTGNTIVTIEDDSVYEISAEIDEYDITKVKLGQRVIFKTNGTGDDEFEGKVKEIAPKATRGANGTLGSNITYAVKVSIDSAADMLKMDMTAKLSIIIESRDDVLTVPYDALQVDDSGEYFIEVTDDVASFDGGTNDGVTEITYDTEKNENDNRRNDQNSQQVEKPNTRTIYVTKGLESDYYVEVISSELKEGMTVIVPSSGDGMNDFMQMLQEQGAMGGF